MFVFTKERGQVRKELRYLGAIKDKKVKEETVSKKIFWPSVETLIIHYDEDIRMFLEQLLN